MVPAEAGSSEIKCLAMSEILQRFERSAVSFSPAVLIGAGLAAVLLGLFLWIGGLGFRKILVAILGAVTGAICGFFIVGNNIVVVALAAAAAVVAAIIERIFIIILAAALAAVFALIILTGPYIENSQAPIPITQAPIAKPALTVSVRGSLKVMNTYALDCFNVIKQASAKLPLNRWIMIAAVLVVVIVAGLLLWRLTFAFSCAALGTMLIFAGMILLLLYKGSAPVSRIFHGSLFYLIVFIAMIFFGTLEQLLLCKDVKRQSTRKKQAGKDEQGPVMKKHDWRTE